MGTSWSERYLPTLLTIIAGLLVVITVELAMLISPGLPSACAQIPDSGLQRKEMIDAIERSNQRLDAIREAIRTQVFRVQVVNADNDRRPAPAPAKSSSTAKPSTPR